MELDVHSLLVKLLVLGSSLLILDAGLRQYLAGDALTDVRCLWNEEQNANPEHAKHDGTDAEGPLIAQIFDDVTRDEASSADTAEEEEVPDGDACGTFVNEVEIGDCGLHKHFVRCHAESAQDTRPQEATVGVGHGSLTSHVSHVLGVPDMPQEAHPDADDEQDDRSDDIDGSLSPDLSDRVEEEDTEAKRQDKPGCCFGEDFDRDAELFRNRCTLRISTLTLQQGKGETCARILGPT